MKITNRAYGQLPDGRKVEEYTITISTGMEAKIITYGGILTSLKVPDRDGKLEDIVLGFDTLEEYFGGNPYFGAIVGRYANRVGGGQYTLNGKTYDLTKNENNNQLHGGNQGFDKAIWDTEEYQDDKYTGVKMTYTSKDMEEGHPGNLKATVYYLFSKEKEFRILYEMVSDKDTHANLTHHSYFNLAASKKDVLSHVLQLDADSITEVNKENIPTGKFMPVQGTPFDFTTPKPVGKKMNELDQPGYDNNYVLNKPLGQLEKVAEVTEPVSKRKMEMWTTEPGVQLYTAGSFGPFRGKGDINYSNHCAICLESQHYPDSPNKENFPSTLREAGKKYNSETIYKFSVEK